MHDIVIYLIYQRFFNYGKALESYPLLTVSDLVRCRFGNSLQRRKTMVWFLLLLLKSVSHYFMKFYLSKDKINCMISFPDLYTLLECEGHLRCLITISNVEGGEAIIAFPTFLSRSIILSKTPNNDD